MLVTKYTRACGYFEGRDSLVSRISAPALGRVHRRACADICALIRIDVSS